jgi:hypothetical protein
LFPSNYIAKICSHDIIIHNQPTCICYSDIELPSCPPEEELPAEGSNIGSQQSTAEAQDNPKGEGAHNPITSPPQSLSVVSSLTDSDPPSPNTSEARLITEDQGNSISSSPMKGKTFSLFCFITLNSCDSLYLLKNCNCMGASFQAYA